jgi:hypothetical protein
MDDRGSFPGKTKDEIISIHHRVLALGPTQPPYQWVTRALILRVKRPGREANHSHQSSAKFKNVWSYTSTPPVYHDR